MIRMHLQKDTTCRFCKAILIRPNAVCEMVMNDEAIITHELTIKEDADGGFKYMGNKILDDGINRIPDYQYRIRVSDD